MSFPWPSTPVGKALMAAFFYAGLVAAGFWTAEKILQLQRSAVDLAAARSRAAPRSRAPRAPRVKRRKKTSSPIRDYIRVVVEDAPDEPWEDIDMGDLIFRRGHWLKKEGDRWVPFEHPGYNF